MKPFDYLSAFLLLFMAITLGEVIMGLAYAFNDFEKTVFYLPHSAAIISTYLFSLDYTMRVFKMKSVNNWSYWMFLLAMIPSTAWLLGTKLLFPDVDPPTTYNFEEVFNRNKPFIYACLATYISFANISFMIIYKIKSKSSLLFPALVVALLVSGIIVDSTVIDYAIVASYVVFFILLQVVGKLVIKDHSEITN